MVGGGGRRREAAVLAGILLLALAARLPRLGESLWYDEGWSSRTLLGSWDAVWQLVSGDAHPPAYAVLMFLWTSVAGDSELALRLPPLLCGLAAVAATAAIGRRLAGPLAGTVAAAALALSPVHVWYATEARSYSFALLLVLVCALATLRLEDPRAPRGWLTALAVALPLAVLTHYFLAAYAVLLPALATLQRHPRRRELRWLGAASLLLLGAFLVLRALTFPELTLPHLRRFTPGAAWWLFFDWFLHGNTVAAVPPGAPAGDAAGPRLALAVAAAAVLARGLWRLPGRERTFLAGCLFAMPVALWLVTAPFGVELYVERALLAALPFFWIAMASGVAFRGRLASAAGAAALLVGVALSLLALHRQPQRWTVYKPRPDWRSATAHLVAAAEGAQRRAVVLVTIPTLEPQYYTRRWRRGARPLEVRRATAADATCAGLAGRPLFVVVNDRWDAGGPELLARLDADATCRRAAVARFPGLALHQFTAAAAAPQESRPRSPRRPVP